MSGLGGLSLGERSPCVFKQSQRYRRTVDVDES